MHTSAHYKYDNEVHTPVQSTRADMHAP